jgi:hypothetical protein
MQRTGRRNRNLILVCGLAIAAPAAAGDVQPVTWSPHTARGCRMNMGPTGAQACAPKRRTVRSS